MRKVAFLGPVGTFGYEVTEREFGNTHELIACPNHSSVVSMVAGGGVEYGVVAVENVLLGVVPETLTAMGRNFRHCYVVRQLSLSIDMRLWQNVGSERLDTVFIFSAAAAQCTALIARLGAEGVMVQSASSTADSLLRASNIPNAAGIGSPQAGADMGLRDISHVYTHQPNCSVADAPAGVNRTRFWVLSREMLSSDQATGTVLRMVVPNLPRALATVLDSFGRHGINLKMLFSAPVADCPGQYAFYADFEAAMLSPKFRDAWEEAARVVNPFFSEVLGSYTV